VEKSSRNAVDEVPIVVFVVLFEVVELELLALTTPAFEFLLLSLDSDPMIESSTTIPTPSTITTAIAPMIHGVALDLPAGCGMGL
jgi:hypothetical protein